MSRVTSAAGNDNSAETPLGPITAEELIDDRALEKPEQDKFRLRDFVADLAQRCRVTPTPANIALYGAWGSGKSSIGNLLETELKDDSVVAFGRFDAFKYAEVPLRRHFLSQVAESFKIKDKKFSEDLYSSTQTQRFRITKTSLVEFALAMVGAAVVLSLVTSLAAVVIAAVASGAKNSFSSTFVGTLRASTPGVVLAIPIIGALLAIAFRRFEISVSQSVPSSDEEFEKLFVALVGAVKDKTKRDRIVVFIDELDRCSPKQVGSVLETLRTFLDVESCIFIVAADQQVLEHALTEGGARQATPADPTNPYYSSGNSYLDKIFHYQLPLPPLLPRRLSRFAYNLIEGRTGVWQHVPNRAELVSVLVPTHVRSPRRVKALLNTFVSLYRVALHRAADGDLDGNVASRASEVAKLVCLRSEFPLFARDLALDARLPEAVLKLSAKPNGELKDLDMPGLSQEVFDKAKQYALGKLPVADLLTREPEPARPPAEDDDPDQPAEETVTPEAPQHTYGQQLLRYLERTRTIAGPQRDLIYLDSSGTAFDLPAEFADRLERDAVDGRTSEVAGEVKTLAPAEQLNAYRLLARLVFEGSVGLETTNVMKSLFAALDVATTDLAPASDDVLSAISNYSGSYQLEPDDLSGALRLSLASDGVAARHVRDSVLARDEIVTYGDLGIIVLEHASTLQGRSNRLAEVLGARIADTTAKAIVEALASAPDQLVTNLIGDLEQPEEPEPETLAPTSAVDTTAATPELEPSAEETFATDLREFAEALLDEGRPAVALAVFVRLLALDTKAGKNAAFAIIGRFAPIADLRPVGLILNALRVRYAQEWPAWLEHVAAGVLKTDVPEQSAAVATALTQLWRKRFPASATDVATADDFQSAASAVARISSSLPLGGEGLDVAGLLSGAPHLVSTEAEATDRAEQHNALYVLVDLNLVPRGVVADATLADAAETAGAPATAAPSPVFEWLFDAANRAVAEDADATAIESFIEAVEKSPWLDEAQRNTVELLAVSALHVRVPETPSPLTPVEIAALLAGGTPNSDIAAGAWVEKFQPGATDLLMAIRPSADGGGLSDPLRSALAALAGEWDGSEKANLLDELGPAFVEGQTNEALFNELRVEGADADRALETILKLFESAGSIPKRTQVLRLWRIVSPTSSKAQRKLVDDVFIPLIGGGKGQAKLALEHFGLVTNVGKPTQTKLKQALDAAAANDSDLQKTVNKVLQNMGWIKKPRKWGGIFG